MVTFCALRVRSYSSFWLCTVLLALAVTPSAAQFSPNPVLMNPQPGATQTVVQQPGTMFNVNRLEHLRFAEQFAPGTSGTGGIREAILDLPLDGGVVVLPAGVTNITQTIVIDKPVILRGHGMGGLSALTPNGYLFSAPSTINSQIASGGAISVQLPASNYLSGVVLEDFQVQGNAGGCGISLIAGGPSTVMRGVTVRRVLSRDSSDCGLLIQDNVFMVEVEGAQFIRNSLDGIRVISSSTLNGKPSQIWIHDVMSDMNGRDALRIEQNVGDVSVFGGTFSDSGQNGLGVYNSSPSSFPGASVNVFGSHFESNTNGGISLGAGSGHLISGNFISSGRGTGIAVWTANPQTSVAATLIGNNLQGNPTDIYVDHASWNVVIGPQGRPLGNLSVLNLGQATQKLVTAPY